MASSVNPTGRRGGSSEQARAYRQEGHDDATIFALLLGLDDGYRRDPRAKKDVIDPAGDAHSLKSGEKKWQVFLYGRKRFLEDDGFQALNGIGTLLAHCIDAFPPRYEDYRGNEAAAKIRLQAPMRELKDRFQRKALLRAFLKKAIFNGGEVNYLTICHEYRYHVYWNDDVVKAMADGFSVENSKARNSGQFDAQKVVFKYRGLNVGELEMRNDSVKHYGQVRFNMIKDRCFELLQDAMLESSEWSPEIIVYGYAVRTFGKWNS